MSASLALDDSIRLALPQVSRSQAQEIAHSLQNPLRKPLTACVIGNILAAQKVQGRFWKELVSEGILQPDELVGDTMSYKVVLEPGTQANRVTERDVRERAKRREEDLKARVRSLDRRIWVNGWLFAHPEKIEKLLPVLRKMSEQLDATGMIGSADISRHELSYQLFANEKALGESKTKAMLKAMGVERLVRYRIDMTIGLEHFIPRKREHMRILILENYDPYHLVQAQLYEHGHACVLGERVHGAIYAQGSVITSKLGDLLNLQESLGAKSVEFLFWGDLDRAGMGELNRLMANEFGIRVVPFGPAYQRMAQLAMERFRDAADNEPAKQATVENLGAAKVSDFLGDAELNYAERVLELNKRVPQEIVTKSEMFKKPTGRRALSGTAPRATGAPSAKVAMHPAKEAVKQFISLFGKAAARLSARPAFGDSTREG